MSDYKVPLDDMRFVMQDVLKIGEFWQSLDAAAELDIDTADAILEEAAKLTEQVIWPLNREADEQGSKWDNGQVIVPAGFKEAYNKYCEGGWNALGGSADYDGMGMPKSLVSAVEEMIQGASISFGLAPTLTAGAALAVSAHASDELKKKYLPKMYSGEWAGAMDLTEPHCGTDLGLIRTKAVPQGDGSYRITGTKIFITWGEHDMTDNIIHLVLAKLPDAPAGSKGISLFLVPKIMVNADGELGDRNGVSCGSIEKKMGIKGCATCVMNFDDAKAWLVGSENKGLACMFTMMNYERLGVGIQGVGVAEQSYQTALAYAKERLQGRSASGAKFPDRPADNLLVHPDVRKMLLTMKAYTEGSRAFYLYIAKSLDLAKFGKDEEARLKAEKISALLTPVAKAFMTDVALESAVHGQQVLGGHGYVREWGQEQHVRDIRITQIYEGTNGIQAMDLIGRKTVGCGGEDLKLFLTDVALFLHEAKQVPENQYFCAKLETAVDDLRSATVVVLQQAKEDPEAAGSAAVDYLDLFGHVAYAFMWAMMADAANRNSEGGDFMQAKVLTARFYMEKLLPKVEMLKARIGSGSQSLMSFSEAHF